MEECQKQVAYCYFNREHKKTKEYMEHMESLEEHCARWWAMKEAGPESPDVSGCSDVNLGDSDISFLSDVMIWHE